MTLKDFLVRVSIDSDAMVRFIADPDGELREAGVAEADRLLLQMGNSAALQASLNYGSETPA